MTVELSGSFCFQVVRGTLVFAGRYGFSKIKDDGRLLGQQGVVSSQCHWRNQFAVSQEFIQFTFFLEQGGENPVVFHSGVVPQDVIAKISAINKKRCNGISNCL